MPHAQSNTATIPIKVSQLVEYRSRRVYKNIEELANSLKSHGQIEPLIVRLSSKTTGKKNAYEIAAGTRRRRAAIHAGIDTLECVVRDLTDQQMIEISIAENRDREDIHPLEEADALQDLHEQHGVPIGEMAARFGRSDDYVIGRLKIARMHEDLRAAFLAGRFGVKGALVLAGIADTMQQRVWSELSKLPDANLSASKIGGFIRDRFLLRLASAPFPINDPDLVEEAGACNRCPKRTGVQSSLFPEDITTEDRCTDLACFTDKKQAWADTLIERATNQGLKVLEKADAREVFKFGDSVETLNPDAKFVACDSKVRLGEGDTTYRELLASAPPPVVVAINPGGAGLELYEKQAVAKAMRAAKVPFVKEWESVCLPKPSASKSSSSDKPDRSEVKREKQVADLAIATLREEVEGHEGVSATQRKKLFQLVALGAARNTWSQVQKAYIRRHKLDDGKTGGDAQQRIALMLEDHISKLSPDECIGFVFEVALLREVLGGGSPDFDGELFKRSLAVTGNKLGDFRKRVVKEQEGGKDATDDETGPKTKRSTDKPKVTAKRGKKSAAPKSRAKKNDDDVEPPASGYGGMCDICNCTRSEPCERTVDDKKHKCTRGPGADMCSLCEEIYDTTDAATERPNPFRFEEIFTAVKEQDLVEDSDGDRDIVRACMERLVAHEKCAMLADGRYKRLG